MRYAPLLVLLALAACDAAGPDATATDARKSDPGFLVTTYDAASGQSSEHRQEKVAVCHYDDDTDSYERIEVSAPALDAHVRHGDGVPNGPVPGANNEAFGEDCEIVQLPVPIGCTATRVANGDGTETVDIIAVLPEGDRPAKGALTTLSGGTNGASESLNLLFAGFINEFGVAPEEGEESAGFRRTETYSEGSDDTVAINVFNLDGASDVCGPYIISEIPLSGSGV